MVVLAEVSSNLDLLKLLTEGSIGAGFIYWLTYKLIPRLQKESESAREEFKTSMKEARTDFLTALNTERDRFQGMLEKERTHTEKHGELISRLADNIRDMAGTIRERVGH
jgi:hypothetical protein